MNATSDPKVPVQVVATDAATEIFLVDARFNRVAKAVGELRTQVEPGLYKLRLRAAQTQVDRLIEVEPGASEPIRAQPVPFVTAVPLEQTADADPRHQELVGRISSATAERRLGSGSRLLVIARVRSGETPPTTWDGLAAHGIGGERLAAFAEGSPESDAGLKALSLDLDPGIYRVRVTPTNAPPHELFVPLAGGWQTALFCFADTAGEGGESVGRPRLTDASVLMLPLGAVFDPSSPGLRLAELLRYGLEAGRPVLRHEAVADMEAELRSSPMLAILSGHLLIREGETSPERLEGILTALGPELAALPDAVALRLGSGGASPPSGLVFASPPMLRASWGLIVAASRRRMSLVPPESVTAQVGEGLVAHPLWLLSGVLEAAPRRGAEAVSFAEAARYLDRLLAIEPSQLGARVREAVEQVLEEASPLERSLLQRTLLQPGASDAGGRLVGQTLRALHVPRYSVARSVQRLKDKLRL